MKRVAAVLASAAALACSSAPAPRRPIAPPPPTAAPEPRPEAPAPPRPEVLVARASTLRAEGDVAGAREQLEAALQAAPSSAEVRIELADLLVADGRELERAATILGTASVGPDPRWHLVAARLAEARADDAGAAAEYGLALDGGIEDPDARLRRALALERLGRREEAIVELERVCGARPDDAVARSRLAELYESAGRLVAAEAEHRWLVEAQPDRAASWERLGRFYERAGRLADAKSAFARARSASGRPDRSLRPLLPSKR